MDYTEVSKAEAEYENTRKKLIDKIEAKFHDHFEATSIELIVFPKTLVTINAHNLKELFDWAKARKDQDTLDVEIHGEARTVEVPWEILSTLNELISLEEHRVTTSNIESWRKIYPKAWQERLSAYIMELEEDNWRLKNRLKRRETSEPQ